MTTNEAAQAAAANAALQDEALKSIASGLGFTSRDIGREFAKAGGDIRECVNAWCEYRSVTNSELAREGSKKQVAEICATIALMGFEKSARAYMVHCRDTQGEGGPLPAPDVPAPMPEVPEKPKRTRTTPVPVVEAGPAIPGLPVMDEDVAAKLHLIQEIFGGGKKGATMSQEDIDRITLEVTAAAREEVLKEFGPNGGKPTLIQVLKEGPDGPVPGKPSVEHSAFPLTIAVLRAGVNAAFVGPAGSGKTTMAERAAKALGMPFYTVSCNPASLKGDVIGRQDPMSEKFFDGPMVQAMRAGGLCLLDEADKLNPQVMPMVNSATANRWLMLPNGERVEATAETRFMLAMNTYGTGATDLYASSRQDAATMDRFFMLDIQYDPGLMAAMTGCDVRVKSPDYSVGRGGLLGSRENWFHYITSVWGALAKHNIKHVVSPRACAMGIKLAEQGVGIHWLQEGLIYKGLKEAQRNLIKEETKTCKL
jgi:hypothetical protein